MAGISDKAIKSNYAENKYRFTGQLYDDDLDWDTYQMKYRTMDPQIGRFWQVDPVASQYSYNSPFAYAENEVTRAIDLEGLEKFIVTKDPTRRSKAFQKTTVTRQVDSKGNLKDQNLRDTKTGAQITNSAVYTYNNNDDENDKGSNKLSPADQFIAKDGIKDVDEKPGTSTEFDREGKPIANTSPTSEGDKLITSEGVTTEINIIDPEKSMNLMKIFSLEINAIEGAVGDKNAKIGISITTNPTQASTFSSLSKEISKLFKNVTVTVIYTDNQNKRSANVSLAATTQK